MKIKKFFFENHFANVGKMVFSFNNQKETKIFFLPQKIKIKKIFF